MAFATINKPITYFNTVTYAGANGTQPVTGTGFQPDFVWIKNRSITADHMLYDSVRGTGTSKALTSDNTDPEGLGTNVGLPSQYGYLSAFGSDGFTVVAGSSNGNFVNTSGNNFVSWNWLGSNTTTNNTAGTISSTVCANTTSGFSIVSYSGNSSSATVGHGLGVAPKFIIIKHRNGADDWTCYHVSLGASQRIQLNNTDAASSLSWGGSPTSSLFYLLGGGATAVNVTGGTYVAYCFAEIKGYSAFGSYAGTGSANGPFLYTGFKPAFVIIKNSTTASNSWHLVDNKRNTYNIEDKYLNPNSSGAEQTYNIMDFTSNGFKLRDSDPTFNASGGVFIYMAFAENPFVGTNNVPTTAR